MMTRFLLLAFSLTFTMAANAKDMASWSDRTLCRLAPELSSDSQFQWHMDKRGLVCTEDGFYREARYVSQSALCETPVGEVEALTPKAFFSEDYLEQTSLSFTSMSQPLLLTQADFNSDGLADFLLAKNAADNHLSLLYGQVNGKFKEHKLPPLAGLSQQLRGAKAADLNNDERVDFIVYGGQGSHWQFINLGNGFEASKIAALGNQNDILDATLMDINADGLADLLPLRNGVDRIKTPFVNTPKGFQVVGQSYSPSINKGYATAIASADFNGDGFADIAVSLEDENNQISLLLGDQDLNNRDNLFLQFPSTNTKHNHSHLEAVDLNNDGQLDLLHAYTYDLDNAIEATNLRVFINQQDCFVDASSQLLPNFPQPLPQSKANLAIANIQVLDINHDGLNDLLLQHQQVQTEGVLLLNTSNQYVDTPLTNWQGHQQHLAGDINGDQMLDIIALQQHDDGHWQLKVYLHTSPLTAPLAPSIPVDFSDISEGQQAALETFLSEHLLPAISLENAMSGTSDGPARDNSKVAWHMISKDAPHEITFLGLDDISLANDNWQILSDDVYFFYPTRDHRDSLDMHSNRRGQIILRGHMHVTPKELRQDIEIFGHRNNNFAMGVLDKGDLLLLEFLP